MLWVLLAFFLVPSFALAHDCTGRYGDGSPILLEAWGGVDKTSEPFVSTNASNKGAARFHGEAVGNGDVTAGVLNYGSANSSRARNGGHGVGSFHYGEVPSGESGYTWGTNAIGATYSAQGVAHGTEVNGVNRSGVAPRRERGDSEKPFISGVYVVAYGNAQTNAGILVETSPTEPAGKPYYGLHLASLPGRESVASDTGILVERVDSGEAFRTIDGQRVALSTDGQVYLKFDPRNGRVEVWKYGVLVASW